MALVSHLMAAFCMWDVNWFYKLSFDEAYNCRVWLILVSIVINVIICFVCGGIFHKNNN